MPHYLEWLGQYLGPAMAAAHPHVGILAWDHNKLASAEYVSAIAGDAAAAAHWWGTAVHWYDYGAKDGLGLEQLDAIHALAPSKPLLATEACFLESLAYSWTVGFLYAADIIADLRHWVGGWTAWNTVLLAGDMYPESYGGPVRGGSLRARARARAAPPPC